MLADAAAAGDVAAAKLLVPYMNQAYGMPTERVETQVPQTLADFAAMPTSELLRLVREAEDAASEDDTQGLEQAS